MAVKYLTPMDRVRWARQIAAMRAEDPPVEWKAIARETGLGVRNCQKLLNQLQESGDPDAPADAMAPIRRHLDVLETVMVEAADTYANAPVGSTGRVGALRLFKEASAETIDYMRLVGLLPRHLGALSAEREMQQVFLEFAEIIRRYEVPEALLVEILQLADTRLTRQPAAIEGQALSAA